MRQPGAEQEERTLGFEAHPITLPESQHMEQSAVENEERKKGIKKTEPCPAVTSLTDAGRVAARHPSSSTATSRRPPPPPPATRSPQRGAQPEAEWLQSGRVDADHQSNDNHPGNAAARVGVVAPTRSLHDWEEDRGIIS